MFNYAIHYHIFIRCQQKTSFPSMYPTHTLHIYRWTKQPTNCSEKQCNLQTQESGCNTINDEFRQALLIGTSRRGLSTNEPLMRLLFRGMRRIHMLRGHICGALKVYHCTKSCQFPQSLLDLVFTRLRGHPCREVINGKRYASRNDWRRHVSESRDVGEVL